MTWKISDCSDYFNVLYSCALHRHKGHSQRKPPKWGWACDEGPEKAPTCTWKPSKEQMNADSAKRGIAPSLSKLKREKGDCRTDRASGLEKSLTLDQMMHLQEDADSADDIKYASGTKNLEAMMNMSVDEGHEDEEAGYDINYLSATKYYDS